MKRVADYFFVLALTFWVGALWAIGYLAVPVVFSTLTDQVLAGVTAGHMFSVVSWLGIVCACYAIFYLCVTQSTQVLKNTCFWFVVVMLVLTLVGQFWVTPILQALKGQALLHDVMKSVLRERFVMWHSVASVLYLIQSVLGVVLVTQAFRQERPTGVAFTRSKSKSSR